ncbi:MAG: ParB/RepB/Spo0J family partition protein [Candidatus Magasanikbacteria bacterium]
MALGKGLDSLIQSDQEEKQSSKTDVSGSGELEKDKQKQQTDAGQVIKVNIEKISPNPHQPRKNFPEEELKDLVRSIKEYGVMQPVTIKPKSEGKYELVAGERRLRASKKANKQKIPAIIKDTSEKEQMELAMIENLQRQDLSPLEEAMAYNSLMQKFDLTQSEVADRVGRSRSNIANMIRLLELPDEIKQALDERRIEAGKARALLSLESEAKQLELFERLLEEELSVRELEQHASSDDTSGKQSSKTKKRKKDPNILAKEEELEAILGTKVNINKKKDGSGEIEIDFYSTEELKQILGEII